MKELLHELNLANKTRKRLKSDIKYIRPLVFLYKDKEATERYDLLTEQYKKAKRELYLVIEKIVEQS